MKVLFSKISQSRLFQGKPHDHMEYVIYEKRRAIIEYIAYYKSADARNQFGPRRPITKRVTVPIQSSPETADDTSESDSDSAADGSPNVSEDEDMDAESQESSSSGDEESLLQACKPLKRRKSEEQKPASSTSPESDAELTAVAEEYVSCTRNIIFVILGLKFFFWCVC